jgi:hypothetical protein
MKKGTRALAVASAAVAVLALAGIASAAYTSPTLSVSYAGNVTRIVATAAVADDATARAAIVIPNGTSITTTAAPGTKVGTVKAQVSALALGGALLPLAGDIIVAPPGAVPAASQTPCIGPVVPQATYLLVLQAAGQTINLPAYVVPTTGGLTAIGTTQLVFCLAPPDIPVASGGATFGAKFLSADLNFAGVFGPITQGAWVGIWLPWNPGVGTVNSAAVAASPALIAPGAISLSGKRVKGRVVLAGKLTQGGIGFANSVRIWGAVGKAKLKPLGTLTTNAGGGFAAFAISKASKATTFQARVVAAGRSAPAVCSTLSALPAPCVNATVNGFTAQSNTVTVR